MYKQIFGSKGFFVLRYRTLEFPGLCLTRHVADDKESSYGKRIPDENDPYSSGGGLGLYIKSDWNFHFRDDLRIDTIENVHLSQTIHTSNIERLATFIWSPINITVVKKGLLSLLIRLFHYFL